MCIQESRAKYVGINNKISKLCDRIDKLQRQKSKLWDKLSWTGMLIKPIMAKVKEKYSHITWDDRDLVPMGLGNRVSVFGQIEDKTVAVIVFIPANLDDGILYYQTAEKKPDYPENSIGALNGFNYVTKEIKSIDDIFEVVEKQINGTW